MGGDASTSEVRDTWEAAAPGWAKWEHVISGGLTQVTDDLLDMAAVTQGA